MLPLRLQSTSLWHLPLVSTTREDNHRTWVVKITLLVFQVSIISYRFKVNSFLYFKFIEICLLTRYWWETAKYLL